MTTPIQTISGLVVGTVESVSPNEIRVTLELDAPGATALNSGTPTSFPRINGYVLIPNEAGATVGFISWIGIERSPYPKRSGLKDFGVIDLPFPLRKMSISPVGTLSLSREGDSEKSRYELARGVVAFPSVGDQVLIPTPEQVTAIVAGRESDKRVEIGMSAMAVNTPICVDPDKIFGRHLAVLGNTGSGKSCSVAGLIRWSVEAAQNKRSAEGRSTRPNQRFIILDPNGEYRKAFADLGERCRIFRVPPVSESVRPLTVPAWFWNGREWACVAHAQPGAQKPLLMRGIRDMRVGHQTGVPREAAIRRYLATYRVQLTVMASLAPTFTRAFKDRMDCDRLVGDILAEVRVFQSQVSQDDHTSALEKLGTEIEDRLDERNARGQYSSYRASELEALCHSLQEAILAFPDEVIRTSISEDTPVFFPVRNLPDHLDRIATDQGGNIAGFISTLGLRLRSMLADPRLGPIIEQDVVPELSTWLEDYIGADGAENGEIAVIDLSLVPSDVTHIIVAVFGRMVFECLQRYRRTNGKALPTVMVLEEAHNFVRRSGDSDLEFSSPQDLCRQAFEKIAREGRKFGLGLVLSSQRPSELSPTVLAQCNTFLLHRIVNDRDQDLVERLVPDNLSGLLRELPSLPSRQAILLGWATPIPVLVEVKELPESQRPQSDDPDFWDVWTGNEERSIDWDTVVNDWGVGTPGVGPQTPPTSACSNVDALPTENQAPDDDLLDRLSPLPPASDDDDIPF